MLIILALVLFLSPPLNTYAAVDDNVGNSSLDLRVGYYTDTSESETLFGMLHKILDKLAALDTMASQMSTMSTQMSTMASSISSIKLSTTGYMLDYTIAVNDSQVGPLTAYIDYVDPNGVSHTVSVGSGNVWVKRGSVITLRYVKPAGSPHCAVVTWRSSDWEIYYSTGNTPYDTITPGYDEELLEHREIGATSDRKIVMSITGIHYTTDFDSVHCNCTLS